jgi:hypothetical protein
MRFFGRLRDNMRRPCRPFRPQVCDWFRRPDGDTIVDNAATVRAGMCAASQPDICRVERSPSEHMSLQDYIIDHRDFHWPELLKSWTWLLPAKFTVWIMNRFGDLFIVLDDGTVRMLDVGVGELKKLAESRDDFTAKIDEGDNANDWLMIPLVDRLVASGIVPSVGQCYSYRQAPILGGDYTVQNTLVLSIAEHYGLFGFIHERIKDLPDGTQVVIKVAK